MFHYSGTKSKEDPRKADFLSILLQDEIQKFDINFPQ